MLIKITNWRRTTGVCQVCSYALHYEMWEPLDEEYGKNSIKPADAIKKFQEDRSQRETNELRGDIIQLGRDPFYTLDLCQGHFNQMVEEVE